MPDPKGFLVVPVGFRADGSIHSLSLDTSDRLKVLIDSVTGSVVVTQSDPANLFVGSHGYDGSNWQKLKVDSNGRLSIDINSVPADMTVKQQTASNFLTGDNVWDGSNWQKLSGQSTGILRNVPLFHKLFNESGISQKLIQGYSLNSTDIAYTITAAKTFYMTSYYINCYNGGVGAQTCYLRIRDTSDVTVIQFPVTLPVNGNIQFGIPFITPVSIAAGYDIVTVSPIAGFSIDAVVTGYEL